LGENLDNSPNFHPDLIFMDVNLDGITCMQKIEDPIQVTFELDLIIKKDLNLNMSLN
jgi:two-component SAPR family response regulator